MPAKSNLPYYAEAYIQHIRKFRPKMYREMEADGNLEATALSVHRSATAAYDLLVKENMARGDNETTAETFASSEVMRQYILLPSERDVPILGEASDELPEEPENELDPEHLAVLKDLGDYFSGRMFEDEGEVLE